MKWCNYEGVQIEISNELLFGRYPKVQWFERSLWIIKQRKRWNLPYFLTKECLSAKTTKEHMFLSFSKKVI